MERQPLTIRHGMGNAHDIMTNTMTSHGVCVYIYHGVAHGIKNSTVFTPMSTPLNTRDFQTVTKCTNLPHINDQRGSHSR